MAKDQPGALQVPTFQALPLHRGGVLGVDRRAERLPPREADVMAVEARRVALPGSPGRAGAPTLGFGAGSSPSVGAQLAARLDRRADLEATRSEVGRVLLRLHVRREARRPKLLAVGRDDFLSARLSGWLVAALEHMEHRRPGVKPCLELILRLGAL